MCRRIELRTENSKHLYFPPQELRFDETGLLTSAVSTETLLTRPAAPREGDEAAEVDVSALFSHPVSSRSQLSLVDTQRARDHPRPQGLVSDSISISQVSVSLSVKT